jgi:hypothetical protein
LPRQGVAGNALGTDDAAVLGLGNDVHAALHLDVPVGGFHFMHEEDVDLIDAQLFPEAVDIGFHLGWGLGTALGEAAVSGSIDVLY